MSPLWWPAAALAGYVLGSASPAALVARLRGVDLRAGGSGNPGATNAGRLMGRWIGLLVGLLDVFKGYLPTYVFALVDPSLGLVAGVAAVLGHVSSPFLKGRGGRGVATSLGAVLAVQPWWALVAVGSFALVVLLTRWVGLGSMVAAAALVACAVVSRAGWPELLFVVVLATVVELRHIPNIVRRVRQGGPGRSSTTEG